MDYFPPNQEQFLEMLENMPTTMPADVLDALVKDLEIPAEMPEDEDMAFYIQPPVPGEMAVRPLGVHRETFKFNPSGSKGLELGVCIRADEFLPYAALTSDKGFMRVTKEELVTLQDERIFARLLKGFTDSDARTPSNIGGVTVAWTVFRPAERVMLVLTRPGLELKLQFHENTVRAWGWQRMAIEGALEAREVSRRQVQALHEHVVIMARNWLKETGFNRTGPYHERMGVVREALLEHTHSVLYNNQTGYLEGLNYEKIRVEMVALFFHVMFRRITEAL